MIISLALILSLQALQQADAAANAASELRRVNTLVGYLLEVQPRTLEPLSGGEDGFVWKLETQSIGAARPIEICRRAVTVTSEQSRRVFQLSTLETCPLEQSS